MNSYVDQSGKKKCKSISLILVILILFLNVSPCLGINTAANYWFSHLDFSGHVGDERSYNVTYAETLARNGSTTHPYTQAGRLFHIFPIDPDIFMGDHIQVKIAEISSDEIKQEIYLIDPLTNSSYYLRHHSLTNGISFGWSFLIPTDRTLLEECVQSFKSDPILSFSMSSTSLTMTWIEVSESSNRTQIEIFDLETGWLLSEYCFIFDGSVYSEHSLDYLEGSYLKGPIPTKIDFFSSNGFSVLSGTLQEKTTVLRM